MSKKADDDGRIAKAATDPVLRASCTIKAYCPGAGDLSIKDLADELRTQVNAVHDGDLKRAETILLAQAQTLDVVMNSLLMKAADCKNLNAFKTYMTMGLRAASQTRMTLETLAEIKNPKPYIQNNRAYQQINNGVAEPHARENTISRNEPAKLKDQTSDQQWIDVESEKEEVRSYEEKTDI